MSTQNHVTRSIAILASTLLTAFVIVSTYALLDPARLSPTPL